MKRRRVMNSYSNASGFLLASAALLLFISALSPPSTAGTEPFGAPIRSGHSGHWFNPDRDGEGLMLEVLAADRALLYWFTYDEQGRQRWMIAEGQRQRDGDAERLDFPELIATRGGRFGPDFDPASVERTVVGSASLEFVDCQHGEFSFDAFGQSMSLPVQRLSRVMGAPCESRHDVPGRESQAHAGQSGSWFDPAFDGQGYALQWMDPQSALITWYSYDPDGEQYWMIGVGELDGAGRLEFPELIATRGARFGADFDPAEVERFVWGRLDLELGCAAGQAGFQANEPVFGRGQFALTRLTGLRGLVCPYVAPSLLDLYQVSYRDLPLPPSTPVVGESVDGFALAEDGTVFGRLRTRFLDAGTVGNRYEIAKLLPGAQTWQVVPDAELEEGQFSDFFVSADGQSLARHRVEPGGEGPPRVVLERRVDEGPWIIVPGLPGQVIMHALVASPGLRSFLGGGAPLGLPFPNPIWRWTPDDGLVIVPDPPANHSPVYSPVPRVVSEDGRIFAGTLFAPDPPDIGWRTRALRWVDDQPETLHDWWGAELRAPSACNLDCSLIYGVGQAFRDPGHPHDRQAWWWRGPNDMGYIGALPVDLDDELLVARNSIQAVTADGSLAVGSYANGHVDLPGLPRELTNEALFWSQRTGLTSMSELASALAIAPAQPWSSRAAAQISSDGRFVLLVGLFFDPAGPRPARIALLELQPRSADW